MQRPTDGGSYRRNPDGSLTLIAPTTGERPCKCRPPERPVVEPDSQATADDAPQSPPVATDTAPAARANKTTTTKPARGRR